jgi:hypothetical protein
MITAVLFCLLVYALYGWWTTHNRLTHLRATVRRETDIASAALDTLGQKVGSTVHVKLPKRYQRPTDELGDLLRYGSSDPPRHTTWTAGRDGLDIDTHVCPQNKCGDKCVLQHIGNPPTPVRPATLLELADKASRGPLDELDVLFLRSCASEWWQVAKNLRVRY